AASRTCGAVRPFLFLGRRPAGAGSDGSISQLVNYLPISLLIDEPTPSTGSAEPATNVIVGLPLARAFEDLLRRADLDQFAGQQEAGALRDARGLVHVMRDEDDG